MIKILNRSFLCVMVTGLVIPLGVAAQDVETENITLDVPDTVKTLLSKCNAQAECYRDVVEALKPTLNQYPDDQNPLVYMRSPEYLFYKALREGDLEVAREHIDTIPNQEKITIFCNAAYSLTSDRMTLESAATTFTLLSEIDLPKGDVSSITATFPTESYDATPWDCRYGFDNIANKLKPTDNFEAAVLPIARAFENLSQSPFWWQSYPQSDLDSDLDRLIQFLGKSGEGMKREDIENALWYKWILADDLILNMCPAIEKVIEVSLENYAPQDNTSVDEGLQIIEDAFGRTGICAGRISSADRAAAYLKYDRPDLAEKAIRNSAAMVGMPPESQLAFIMRLETYRGLFAQRQTIPASYRSEFDKDMRRAQAIADSIIEEGEGVATPQNDKMRERKLVADVLFFAGHLNLVPDPERAKVLGERFNARISALMKPEFPRPIPQPPARLASETWQEHHARVAVLSRSRALRAILDEIEDDNPLSATPDLNQHLLTDEAYLLEFVPDLGPFELPKLVTAVARAGDPAMAERLQSAGRQNRTQGYKPNLAIAGAWHRQGDMVSRNVQLQRSAQELLRFGPGESSGRFVEAILELGAGDWFISTDNPLLESTTAVRPKAPKQQSKWALLSTLLESGDDRLHRAAAKDIAAYLPTVNKIETTRKTLLEAMLPHCKADWMTDANQAYIDTLARQTDLIYPAGEAAQIYKAGCEEFGDAYTQNVPMKEYAESTLQDAFVQTEDWMRLRSSLLREDDPKRLFGQLGAVADKLETKTGE